MKSDCSSSAIACAFALGRLARLAGTVVGRAGTGRDQAADDHVFLQTAQVVRLAHDRGFGQHAGGFWNDAAEMKLSVDSDALVIPSSRFS